MTSILHRGTPSPSAILNSPLLSRNNSSVSPQPPPSPSLTSSSSATADAPPVQTGSIINKQASASSSLYQNCRSVLDRLSRVPGFAGRFLDCKSFDREDSVDVVSSDPVSRSLRALRLGSSLCYLFNALGLDHQLDVNAAATPSNFKACQRGTAHFVMACKQDLKWPDVDLFAIHELYGQDTNGVVKVIHTVTKLLDRLESEGALLPPTEGSGEVESHAGPSDERSMIIREILDSERKYVQDLEVLQDYQRQVHANDVLTQDQMHNLFLNLNTLADFQRRFLIGVEANASLPPDEQRFGHLFLQMEEHFSVYEPYCANLDAAQELAIREKTTLMQLSHVLDPVSELAPLIIKPVQRICKYPLLLGALVKNTPKTMPHFSELQAGHAAIMRVTDRVNETKRREENHQAVVDLNRRVEDWKGHDINSFGELLLHDVFSVIKNDSEREYSVYLFERIILCCKESAPPSKKSSKSNGSLKGKTSIASSLATAGRRSTALLLKGRIFINNVTGTATSIHKSGHHLLEVRWRGDVAEEAFALKFRTEELLKQWEKAIGKAVEDVAKRRRSNHLSVGRRHDHALASSPLSHFPATPMMDGSNSPYPWQGPSSGGEQELINNFSDSGRSTPSSMMYGSARRVAPGMRSSPSSDRVSTRPGYTSYASSRSQASFGDDAYHYRDSTSTHSLRPQQSLEWSSGPSSGQYHPIAMMRQGSNGSSIVSQPPPPRPALMIRTRSASSPDQITAGYSGNTSPRIVADSDWSSTAAATPDLTTNSRSMGSHDLPSRSSSRVGANAAGINLVGGHKPGGTNSGGTLASESSVASRLKRFSSSSLGTHRSSATSNTSASASPYPSSSPYLGSSAIVPIITAELSASPIIETIAVKSQSPFASAAFRIKINFEEDTFVIVGKGDITYRELLDKVMKKLKLCGHSIADESLLRLKYEDEDGDLILIMGTEDITMALQDLYEAKTEVAQQPTLKLVASVDQLA